jgi:hypothetical protein
MKALKVSTKDERKANNVYDTIEQENQTLKKMIYSMKRAAE